mgnify:CR=1 FL=1
MSLEVHIEKKLNGFTLRSDFTAGNTATAILGASGCGKSMTLRCIAGIVRPDEGRIVLDGRVLFDSAQGIDLPPQQRNVGLLFQNYALFPNMTVEQNILCALKKEKDPAARRAACAEALRAMRLEELAKRLPGALSGGQQQRAAIARALVQRARVLLADEPIASLDPESARNVMQTLRDLNQKDGLTVVVTLHQVDYAMRFCPRTVALKKGEIVYDGPTERLTPQFLAELYGAESDELFAAKTNTQETMPLPGSPVRETSRAA